MAERVWPDLFRERLVTTAGIDNGLEGPVPPKRTTDYGDEFLDFVGSPLV